MVSTTGAAGTSETLRSLSSAGAASALAALVVRRRGFLGAAAASAVPVADSSEAETAVSPLATAPTGAELSSPGVSALARETRVRRTRVPDAGGSASAETGDVGAPSEGAAASGAALTVRRRGFLGAVPISGVAAASGAAGVSTSPFGAARRAAGGPEPAGEPQAPPGPPPGWPVFPPAAPGPASAAGPIYAGRSR